MIVRPTVFVIGAGAHQPYGFPVGGKLLEDILGLKADGLRTEVNEFPESTLTEFQDQFRESRCYSIDVFLQSRLKDWGALGKRCIARVIHGYETSFAQTRVDRIRPGDWISWLLNIGINPYSLDDFAKNKIAFITFNYDRLLEHFLFRALKAKFNQSDDATKQALETIPIIHVHGTIGRLPSQVEIPGAYVLPFGKPAGQDDGTHHSTIKEAAQNIRLFHEDAPESTAPDMELAHKLLCDADLIKFLGFSYQIDNLNRLKLVGNKSFNVARIITGTIQGISAPYRNELKSHLEGSCNGGNLRFANESCYEHFDNCGAIREMMQPITPLWMQQN